MMMIIIIIIVVVVVVVVFVVVIIIVIIITGEPVPQTVDSRVERLRDALMDDARERVDDLGEDLVVGETPAYGIVVCVRVCIVGQYRLMLRLCSQDPHISQAAGHRQLWWLLCLDQKHMF